MDPSYSQSRDRTYGGLLAITFVLIAFHSKGRMRSLALNTLQVIRTFIDFQIRQILPWDRSFLRRTRRRKAPTFRLVTATSSVSMWRAWRRQRGPVQVAAFRGR